MHTSLTFQYVSEGVLVVEEDCFPDCWKASLLVPVFKNLGNSLQLKTTVLLIFFLWLVKSLKNL